MVLGLIEVLFGKKKKNEDNHQDDGLAHSNNSNFEAHSQPTMQNSPQATQQNNANGVNQNNQGNLQQQQVQQQNSQNQTNDSLASQANKQKRPISEVLIQINNELKETSQKVTTLVSDVRDIQNSVSEMTSRLNELEEKNKKNDEKFNEVDSSLNKFLSLYEVVNNQYNPFVSQEENFANLSENINSNSLTQTKEINLEQSNNSASSANQEQDSQNLTDNLEKFKENIKEFEDSSLLELDTINIQEAAGNAVPLTKFKSDTNSLVIILSWLEYMIKRVGIEETRNNLRYYTEVLKWTTPEVYFELDKYLKGMKDIKEIDGSEKLNVKDHIVSLYFISKLNEKPLDEKLTKAVLNIIKNY